MEENTEEGCKKIKGPFSRHLLLGGGRRKCQSLLSFFMAQKEGKKEAPMGLNFVKFHNRISRGPLKGAGEGVAETLVVKAY